MKRKRKLLITVLCLVLAMMAWSRSKYDTMEVDGVKRRYIVSAPQEKGKRPLLLVLHGGYGTARGTARIGFSRLTKERGFLVVYPEGLNRRWNDGRIDAHPSLLENQYDDVKFLTQLIDKLEKDYLVDPDQIYMTGISNGAFMSYRMAVEMPGRLAGIAPMIGGMNLTVKKKFEQARPTSVMIVQGSEDPAVPYDGGQVGGAGKKRGSLLPTEKAMAMWAELNGCSKPKVQKLEDKVDDGCTVEVTSFQESRSGSEVYLYRIVGGGHTVPSGRQYLPESLIGKICYDLDSVELVGDFCQGKL